MMQNSIWRFEKKSTSSTIISRCGDSKIKEKKLRFFKGGGANGIYSAESITGQADLWRNLRPLLLFWQHVRLDFHVKIAVLHEDSSLLKRFSLMIAFQAQIFSKDRTKGDRYHTISDTQGHSKTKTGQEVPYCKKHNISWL